MSINGFAQSAKGILKGTVSDAATGKSLFGVSIYIDSNISASGSSFPDGHYLLSTGAGLHEVTYKLNGFQTKVITNTSIRGHTLTQLDIILYPLSGKLNYHNGSKDSVNHHDSLIHTLFFHESRLSIYNQIPQVEGLYDKIHAGQIQPGSDIDASQLLKRLNGVILQNSVSGTDLRSPNIFGLGERYNQLLFNGASLNSFNPLGKMYPTDLLPAEGIDYVAVQKLANSSIPADVAGGTILVKTKDLPDKNFLYVQAGAGFSDATRGKDFKGDKRVSWETFGFPGSKRELPAEFPTTRSQSSLSQKNPQEQVFLSKLLSNNLAPHQYGSSKPNEKVLIGLGRIINLKKGERIGIIAYLNRQTSEYIDESTVQVLPAVATNPFPFSDLSKVLIRSQSSDVNYHYSSCLSGILNGSVIFGKNKVSVKSFFGSQFINSYTQRSQLSKPDEDTLSHAGYRYLTEQRKFLNVQLAGEHALGKSNKFKLDWQASYSYFRQQNPDERNFLLRQDSSNSNNFEIAQQTAASLSSSDANFTNSGRLWRDFTDHNFTGSVNILVPFNLLRLPQVVSGGIYIQTRNRIFFSDLLLVQGHGFFPLENLIASERYFPGGLSVKNYYTKVKIVPGGNYILDATNRANYTASANLGASYIKLENHLTRNLSLQWGFRLESNSQLVSNTQYNYFDGYRNPQLGTLDENTRVIRIDFLPSFNLTWLPVRKFLLHASFNKTVNRPQLQELSLFRYYDATSFMVRTGNPSLASSGIENYDAGVSWFANATNSISLSAFYKKIEQPIENILSAYSNSEGNLVGIPYNTPPADIRGITASLKINFNFISSADWLSGVSFFGNGNWLTSKVKEGPVKSSATPFISEHSLSGSPDYTLNAGMVIQYPRIPGLTILYNRTGDYITMVGSGAKYQLVNGNTVSAIPDYRVKGREQLDIQISQKMFKEKAQIIIGVNNLSKDPYTEYQDLNGNSKFDSGLLLKNDQTGKSGFFQDGVDNTVRHVNTQRTYYLTLSYLF